jgi:hypothetical protein
MGFCPEDIFRVALLSSGSNIGRSSRLMSDVTGVLGSIPVTADASAWAAFAGTGGAHWEVLYQVPAAGMTDAVDFSPGTGEVAAYRLLDSAADVEVLDVTDDGTFYSSIYESNVVRYGMSYATSVYFPFESAVFDPFSVENTNVAGDLVPAGAAGCWVTLIGAGANGTRGGVSAAAASGGDGGGGAKIARSFIPVASLGSTYSLTRGTTPGSDTTFMSGGVNVTAGGGAGRAGGSVAVTLPGVSLTAVNGSNGGLGSSGGGGASNTGGAVRAAVAGATRLPTSGPEAPAVAVPQRGAAHAALAMALPVAQVAPVAAAAARAVVPAAARPIHHSPAVPVVLTAAVAAEARLPTPAALAALGAQALRVTPKLSGCDIRVDIRLGDGEPAQPYASQQTAS